MESLDHLVHWNTLEAEKGCFCRAAWCEFDIDNPEVWEVIGS